ncbi:MAG: PspC domain-containing protein [Chloroflexota bacterium]|nr:PspC domain-containing protein [Chloroflexota bacterium]
MSGRLERSRTNRVISGVCGGIADYLDIDATFVRVVMVILAFPFGVGVLIYFLLLFLMPNPGEATPFVRPVSPGDPTVDPTIAAPAAVTPAAPRVVDPLVAERRRNGLGILLVAVGAVFLLGNMGAFRFIDWHYIWPLVLIALGVYFIAQRSRS